MTNWSLVCLALERLFFPCFPCCPCCSCCFAQDADAATTESFEWLSQLRFDFDPNAKDPTQGLTVRMADARFEYGFEYLGIGERLVQTPLTDR